MIDILVQGQRRRHRAAIDDVGIGTERCDGRRDALREWNERFDDVALGSQRAIEVERFARERRIILREIVERDTQLLRERLNALVRRIDQLTAKLADLAVGEKIPQGEHASADAVLCLDDANRDTSLSESVAGGEARDARTDDEHRRTAVAPSGRRARSRSGRRARIQRRHRGDGRGSGNELPSRHRGRLAVDACCLTSRVASIQYLVHRLVVHDGIGRSTIGALQETKQRSP